MFLVDSITKYILTRQFHVATHLNNTASHTYKSMSRDKCKLCYLCPHLSTLQTTLLSTNQYAVLKKI